MRTQFARLLALLSLYRCFPGRKAFLKAAGTFPTIRRQGSCRQGPSLLRAPGRVPAIRRLLYQKAGEWPAMSIATRILVSPTPYLQIGPRSTVARLLRTAATTCWRKSGRRTHSKARLEAVS